MCIYVDILREYKGFYDPVSCRYVSQVNLTPGPWRICLSGQKNIYIYIFFAFPHMRMYLILSLVKTTASDNIQLSRDTQTDVAPGLKEREMCDSGFNGLVNVLLGMAISFSLFHIKTHLKAVSGLSFTSHTSTRHPCSKQSVVG